MQTNGQSMIDILREEVENLLVVKRLFGKPEMGWLRWAETIASLINQGLLSAIPATPRDWENYVKIVLQQIDIEPLVTGTKWSNPTSISGRMTTERAPRWLYGMILPTILTGDFERHELSKVLDTDPRLSDFASQVQKLTQVTELSLLNHQITNLPTDAATIPLKRAAAAKLSRLQFEQGAPLYIGEIDSPERYRRLRPVLVYEGNGVYVVGHGEWKRTIRANNHVEALHDARQWVLAQRRREIDAALDAANKVAKKNPPLVRDLLLAILRTDQVLMSRNNNVPLAWVNTHTHNGFQGKDFCYLTKCSPLTAVKMAQLAIKEGGDGANRDSILVNAAGRVADYLGMKNLTIDEAEGTYQWDGDGFNGWRPVKDDSDGEIEKGIVYSDKNEPAFITRLSPIDHPVFSHRVVAYVNEHTPLVDSFVPASWNLTKPDLCAWAIYAGINALRKAP